LLALPVTATVLHLAGERLLLDPDGALFWPAAGVLAVADLHLEKGTAAARRGSLVPPWDTRITLDRLAALLARWRPARVVLLGDSFHDRHAAARLPPGEAARLAGMAEAAEFVWVSGNHDPLPPEGLRGLAVAEWRHGTLAFRHQAWQAQAGAAAAEVCGHHHPKARVQTRAGWVSRACFVAAPDRLMLPALGAYTGGLDVAHPEIAALFPGGGQVFLLGRERLFRFALGHVGARGAGG